MIMTYREFKEALSDWGEYSASIPSGRTPGKKWLRREPYGAPESEATWYIGEYGPVYVENEKEFQNIYWTRIEIDYTGHLLECLGAREQK